MSNGSLPLVDSVVARPVWDDAIAGSSGRQAGAVCSPRRVFATGNHSGRAAADVFPSVVVPQPKTGLRAGDPSALTHLSGGGPLGAVAIGSPLDCRPDRVPLSSESGQALGADLLKRSSPSGRVLILSIDGDIALDVEDHRPRFQLAQCLSGSTSICGAGITRRYCYGNRFIKAHR